MKRIKQEPGARKVDPEMIARALGAKIVTQTDLDQEELMRYKALIQNKSKIIQENFL